MLSRFARSPGAGQNVSGIRTRNNTVRSVFLNRKKINISDWCSISDNWCRVVLCCVSACHSASSRFCSFSYPWSMRRTATPVHREKLGCECNSRWSMTTSRVENPWGFLPRTWGARGIPRWVFTIFRISLLFFFPSSSFNLREEGSPDSWIFYRVAVSRSTSYISLSSVVSA